jgi:crossover junction endodeoxyribonuclease RusA
MAFEATPAVEVVLPWPPSVNNYYVPHGRHGRHISKRGKAYRVDVLEACWRLGYYGCPVRGACRIEVDCYPIDRRRRDLGNLDKALLDSLTKANIWADDSQVKSQKFDMMAPGHALAGRVVVRIYRATVAP